MHDFGNSIRDVPWTSMCIKYTQKSENRLFKQKYLPSQVLFIAPPIFVTRYSVSA